MSVEQHDAFIIHMRKYTDTRVILDLFTRHQGLVSVVYQKNKQRKSAAIVHMFTPYHVEYRGNSSLKTLNFIEVAGAGVTLRNKNLFCGFYLNEIVQRCLAHGDGSEALFAKYCETLFALNECDYEANGKRISIVLRRFELFLLAELGFAVSFDSDIHHNSIVADLKTWYRFVPGDGFYLCNIGADDFQIHFNAASKKGLIPGVAIAAIAKGDFTVSCAEKDAEHYAKLICRQALRQVLGERPIKSRELFGV